MIFSIYAQCSPNQMEPAQRSRASVEQINEIINYMNTHREFAAGKSKHPPGSYFSLEREWQRLADDLHNVRGVIKTVEQWQRVRFLLIFANSIDNIYILFIVKLTVKIDAL